MYLSIRDRDIVILNWSIFHFSTRSELQIENDISMSNIFLDLSICRTEDTRKVTVVHYVMKVALTSRSQSKSRVSRYAERNTCDGFRSSMKAWAIII